MKFKLDLDDLNRAKTETERNERERLQFVKFWAEYVKTHSDEEWSRQQNILIDSQMPKDF